MPFRRAFSIASATASSTISTPHTSPASSAIASAIVPMPQNRSSTFSRPVRPGELHGRRRRGARPSRCWSGRRRPGRCGSAGPTAPPRVRARALDDLRLARARGLGHARRRASTGTRRRAWPPPARRRGTRPRARDHARLELTGSPALAHDEVAQQPVLVAPVPRGEALRRGTSRRPRCAARPRARRRGCPRAPSSIRSQRPGAVEAEHELAVVVLAERVLELVAVAQLLDGGHDRLDRRAPRSRRSARARRAPAPPSRRAGARRGAPARARPGAAPRGSTRSGLGSSSSTVSASANERFDFVTRARTRSPGTAPRTNTT